MKSLSFRKDLIGVQEELLRFAYKLTTDSDGGKLSFKQGKNCQMIDFRCILIVFGCFWDAGFSIFASV